MHLLASYILSNLGPRLHADSKEMAERAVTLGRVEDDVCGSANQNCKTEKKNEILSEGLARAPALHLPCRFLLSDLVLTTDTHYFFGLSLFTVALSPSQCPSLAVLSVTVHLSLIHLIPIRTKASIAPFASPILSLPYHSIFVASLIYTSSCLFKHPST